MDTLAFLRDRERRWFASLSRRDLLDVTEVGVLTPDDMLSYGELLLLLLGIKPAVLLTMGCARRGKDLVESYVKNVWQPLCDHVNVNSCRQASNSTGSSWISPQKVSVAFVTQPVSSSLFSFQHCCVVYNQAGYPEQAALIESLFLRPCNQDGKESASASTSASISASSSSSSSSSSYIIEETSTSRIIDDAILAKILDYPNPVPGSESVSGEAGKAIGLGDQNAQTDGDEMLEVGYIDHEPASNQRFLVLSYGSSQQYVRDGRVRQHFQRYQAAAAGLMNLQIEIRRVR